MRPGKAGRVEALACDGCGGIWLDQALGSRFSQAVEEKVTLDVSKSARILGEAVAARAKFGSVDTAPDRLPCVVCAQPLRRVHVERAHFDLDICDAHGIFFDRGELQYITYLVGTKAPSQMSSRMDRAVAKGLKGHGDGSTAGAVALGVLGIIFDLLT